MDLKPEAVTRWIERLHYFFPGLDRFDRPDPKFDEKERKYKLDIARDLRAALDQAGSDDEIADAIHGALVKSNLVPWRTYWPMSPKGDANRERLWPALGALARAARGDPAGHPEALDSFVSAWGQAVSNSTPDAPRQIAEFLFLHLAPDTGIYIRHSVREKLWLEAVGSPFPKHASMAETYVDELRFMQAVRRAFEDRGLAPRDMIDVQAALWVVHNYQDEDTGAKAREIPTRGAIEAAMDEYEKLGADGFRTAHPQFRESQEFWVRSTRRRASRVFPSKPIAALALGVETMSGGWSSAGAAASVLHNAGYIIVDKDDQPLAVPGDKPFLLSGADRIGICALNCHIAPARERGEPRASIRAGDLKNDLMPGESLADVCHALKGRAFQELANVPPPAQEGPDTGTTTIFTFDLSQRGDSRTMNAGTSGKHRATTNLILYGPPGTGKTYATAREAVRLCLGEAIAETLNRRPELMKTYHDLVREGRIEFVTFHQSYSYEEFVEGLRPTTESGGETDDDGRGQSIGGFSLKPHDGIFKRISERARLDTGESGGFGRLDRSRAIFKVALGARGSQEDRIRYGLENGLIHTDWGEDIDWSDERFDRFSEIRSEWKARKNPDASGHDGNIVVTYAFRAGMQIGDYVVVSDGRDRIRAIGKVAGDYFFDSGADFHPHRRRVDWIWRDNNGTERDRFYPKIFRRHAVYQLDPDQVDWDGLEEIVLGEDAARATSSARDYVLIIDEINRANISKVFGELITLLEPDKRLGAPNEIRLRLPYSGKSFGVPANLHVIGTMNTADRSIALLDTALRRRFGFRELQPDPSLLGEDVDGINLRLLLETINQRIEYLFDREHQIGHAYFMGCRSRADIEGVMRNSVIPLLAEYFFDDWSKIAMILEGGPVASDGGFEGRFLRAEKLVLPGFETDRDDAGTRLRWIVKEQFDFVEFAAA